MKRTRVVTKTRYEPCVIVLSRCLGFASQGPDVKGLQHRREINKKTRSGDKKLAKSMKVAAKVGFYRV